MILRSPPRSQKVSADQRLNIWLSTHLLCSSEKYPEKSQMPELSPPPIICMLSSYLHLYVTQVLMKHDVVKWHREVGHAARRKHQGFPAHLESKKRLPRKEQLSQNQTLEWIPGRNGDGLQSEGTLGTKRKLGVDPQPARGPTGDMRGGCPDSERPEDSSIQSLWEGCG